MDPNEISQTAIDSVAQQPFLEVVLDICDRVLQEVLEGQEAPSTQI
jgi:hypothetical protein